jgi:hypothetical protein
MDDVIGAKPLDDALNDVTPKDILAFETLYGRENDLRRLWNKHVLMSGALKRGRDGDDEEGARKRSRGGSSSSSSFRPPKPIRFDEGNMDPPVISKADDKTPKYKCARIDTITITSPTLLFDAKGFPLTIDTQGTSGRYFTIDESEPNVYDYSSLKGILEEEKKREPYLTDNVRTIRQFVVLQPDSAVVQGFTSIEENWRRNDKELKDLGLTAADFFQESSGKTAQEYLEEVKKKIPNDVWELKENHGRVIEGSVINVQYHVPSFVIETMNQLENTDITESEIEKIEKKMNARQQAFAAVEKGINNIRDLRDLTRNPVLQCPRCKGRALQEECTDMAAHHGDVPLGVHTRQDNYFNNEIQHSTVNASTLVKPSIRPKDFSRDIRRGIRHGIPEDFIITERVEANGEAQCKQMCTRVNAKNTQGNNYGRLRVPKQHHCDGYEFRTPSSGEFASDQPESRMPVRALFPNDYNKNGANNIVVFQKNADGTARTGLWTKNSQGTEEEGTTQYQYSNPNELTMHSGSMDIDGRFLHFYEEETAFPYNSRTGRMFELEINQSRYYIVLESTTMYVFDQNLRRQNIRNNSASQTSLLTIENLTAANVVLGGQPRKSYFVLSRGGGCHMFLLQKHEGQGGEIEMLQKNEVANFTATKIVQSGPDTFVLAGWRMDSSRRVHELRVFRIEPSKTHLSVTTEERERVGLPNANMHEPGDRHTTSDGKIFIVVPEGNYRKIWKRLGEGEETWKWYTTVQFDTPIVNVVYLSCTDGIYHRNVGIIARRPGSGLARYKYQVWDTGTKYAKEMQFWKRQSHPITGRDFFIYNNDGETRAQYDDPSPQPATSVDLPNVPYSAVPIPNTNDILYSDGIIVYSTNQNVRRSVNWRADNRTSNGTMETLTALDVVQFETFHCLVAAFWNGTRSRVVWRQSNTEGGYSRTVTRRVPYLKVFRFAIADQSGAWLVGGESYNGTPPVQILKVGSNCTLYYNLEPRVQLRGRIINKDYEGLRVDDKEENVVVSHPDWNNKYLAEKVEGGYRIIENTKKGMEEITWESLPPTFEARRSSTFERRRWQDNKCRRCGFIGLHPRDSDILYNHEIDGTTGWGMKRTQARELNKPYDDIDWTKVLIWEEWDGLEGEYEESEDTARKPKVQFGQTYELDQF